MQKENQRHKTHRNGPHETDERLASKSHHADFYAAGHRCWKRYHNRSQEREKEWKRSQIRLFRLNVEYNRTKYGG
jgi:hypothetical protein